MTNKVVRSRSGRAVDELNISALREGQLTAEDFRIGAETLMRQADTAEAAGYRQLAENLRRAAELTNLSNRQLLEIYNALRPRRSTFDELMDLAHHLQNDLHMPLVAAFVREAAEVYRARGILKTL
jgi:propanediol dehydratase small subunit